VFARYFRIDFERDREPRGTAEGGRSTYIWEYSEARDLRWTKRRLWVGLQLALKRVGASSIDVLCEIRGIRTRGKR
jgi:hypothetical protein